ncbi:MAG: chlorite dismutase family protein [Lentisphaeria bacterium]|nr:chlorite dismutase family protein [Lentisphaeria bacterium]
MADKRYSDNIEVPDIRDRGMGPDRQPIFSDRRIFMQLQAFRDCEIQEENLIAHLKEYKIQGALLRNIADPSGYFLITYTEDPTYFIETVGPCLRELEQDGVELEPELSMLGRSYSIGYEQDLDETLIDRPVGRLLNPDLDWHVWYPVRRKGSFEDLELAEQRKILGEHGTIGRSYGAGGLAQDIRLDCHGLDTNDHDFLIALLSDKLHPLSALVHRMRKTVQTKNYIAHMGPFLVGKKIWNS